MSRERPVRRLKDIEKLGKLEKLIMKYFLTHISVGEIIAVIDIREEVKRLRDPELVPEFDDVIIEFHVTKALDRLVEQGYLEHSGGVYNLAEPMREELLRSGKWSPGRRPRIDIKL